MRHPPHDLKGLFNIIPLHSSTAVPLQSQLYKGLRKAIVSGQLLGGTRIPSTRALASELGLSRTTVLIAYEQLFLEGYLESHPGSGTYVAQVLPDELLSAHQQSAPSQLMRTAPLPPVSSPFWSQTFCLQSAFKVGQPALDAFPSTLWQRLLFRRVHRSWPNLFGYQAVAGYQPLREAIASYLGVARGVRCSPEQVLVVSGAQQGLDLAARVLLPAGAAVWMEDPGYFGACWALQTAGARLIPVPVDTAGFDVAAAQALNPDARLAFVTPSHQFPLGATMSLERRLALLDWAKDHHGWIIEDDYDSEYRYAGRPLPALQGLDEAGRVLYVGTFSKVLFPALRLGYLVAPPDLVDTFVKARKSADFFPPALQQAVVADFMIEGHFLRHIRRMRTLYAERQALLRSAITQQLSGMLEVVPDQAGMHLTVWLPEDIDAERVAHYASQCGVQVMPLSDCTTRSQQCNALLLGYAGTDEGAIAHGVRVLGNALQSSRTPRSTTTC